MNLNKTENYGQEDQGFQNNELGNGRQENETSSVDHSITNNAEPDYGNEFSSEEFNTDELGNENLGNDNLGDDELNNNDRDEDQFETESDDELGNEELDNEGLDDINEQKNL